MIWVLLFGTFMGGAKDDHPVLLSHEFTSQERCEAAGEAFGKKAPGHTRWVCVQK